MTIQRAIALIEERPYANVACFGIAFKANVDDLRESPALRIALNLATKFGSRIKIVEPNIRILPCDLSEYQVELLEVDEAVRSCEIAILLVDHDEFKLVPLAERRHLDVLDTRGYGKICPFESKRDADFQDCGLEGFGIVFQISFRPLSAGRPFAKHGLGLSPVQASFEFWASLWGNPPRGTAPLRPSLSTGSNRSPCEVVLSPCVRKVRNSCYRPRQ